MKRFACLSVVAAAMTVSAASAARGDIPPPPAPRAKAEQTAPTVIKVDGRARDVRIVIPEKILRLQEPQANNAPERGRTILAGLAMSLALGSMFFVKRQNLLVRKTAITIVGGCALFAVGGVLCADMAPGPFYRRNQRQRPMPPQTFVTVMLPPGTEIATNAIIETVKEGDAITIIVPPRIQARGEKVPAAPVRPDDPEVPEPRKS